MLDFFEIVGSYGYYCCKLGYYIQEKGKDAPRLETETVRAKECIEENGK